MLRTVQIQAYIASVVESVVSSFPAICKALRRIARGDIRKCTGAALAEANGLFATITTFEFIFALLLEQGSKSRVQIVQLSPG